MKYLTHNEKEDIDPTISHGITYAGYVSYVKCNREDKLERIIKDA